MPTTGLCSKFNATSVLFLGSLLESACQAELNVNIHIGLNEVAQTYESDGKTARQE